MVPNGATVIEATAFGALLAKPGPTVVVMTKVRIRAIVRVAGDVRVRMEDSASANYWGEILPMLRT